METQELLYSKALSVRNALVSKKNFDADKKMNMVQFPLERCDQASYLLMEYLKQGGITWFSRVYAEGFYMHRRISHVWLENEEFVLDITGDQLNLFWNNVSFDPVVVTSKGDYFFHRLALSLHTSEWDDSICLKYQKPDTYASYASSSPGELERDVFDINKFKEYLFSTDLIN